MEYYRLKYMLTSGLKFKISQWIKKIMAPKPKFRIAIVNDFFVEKVIDTNVDGSLKKDSEGNYIVSDRIIVERTKYCLMEWSESGKYWAEMYPESERFQSLEEAERALKIYKEADKLKNVKFIY